MKHYTKDHKPARMTKVIWSGGEFKKVHKGLLIQPFFYFYTPYYQFMEKQILNKELSEYCRTLESEFMQIGEKTKIALYATADYIVSSLNKSGHASLLFICTHNSRRSQFSQIWTSMAAHCYGLTNIETFSGGTEVTALNPRVINALDQAGFVVNTSGESRENPEYRLSGGEYFNSPVMFSKKINHPSNPSSGFCAIMVCSDADESCPFVPGAEERISLPYHDPKEFDGTEQEELKYNERCRQIARDMFYMMLHVKNRL